MKTDPKIAILVEPTGIESGYAHINARAIVLDGRTWHFAFNRKLQPCDYFGAFDSVMVGVSSQMGSYSDSAADHMRRRPYGVQFGVSQLSSGDLWIGLETGKRIAQAAALLDRRMTEALGVMGSGSDVTDVIIALGIAMRADSFMHRGESRSGDAPEGLRRMSPRDARWWIEQQIEDLAARMYPDRSAA